MEDNYNQNVKELEIQLKKNDGRKEKKKKKKKKALGKSYLKSIKQYNKLFKYLYIYNCYLFN